MENKKLDSAALDLFRLLVVVFPSLSWREPPSIPRLSVLNPGPKEQPLWHQSLLIVT